MQIENKVIDVLKSNFTRKAELTNMKFGVGNIENRNKIYFQHSRPSDLTLTAFLLREEVGRGRGELIINVNLQTASILFFLLNINHSDWVCTAVMSNDVMKDLRG